MGLLAGAPSAAFALWASIDSFVGGTNCLTSPWDAGSSVCRGGRPCDVYVLVDGPSDESERACSQHHTEISVSAKRTGLTFSCIPSAIAAVVAAVSPAPRSRWTAT